MALYKPQVYKKISELQVRDNTIKLSFCSLDETKWNQGLAETFLDFVSLHQSYIFIIFKLWFVHNHIKY